MKISSFLGFILLNLHGHNTLYICIKNFPFENWVQIMYLSNSILLFFIFLIEKFPSNSNVSSKVYIVLIMMMHWSSIFYSFAVIARIFLFNAGVVLTFLSDLWIQLLWNYMLFHDKYVLIYIFNEKYFIPNKRSTFSNTTNITLVTNSRR